MPTYTCSICGRKFDRGATIIGTKVLCPDCGEEYDELIAEMIYDVLSEYLKNGKIDVESVLNKHKDKLKKFEKMKNRIKVMVIREVLREIGQR